MGISSQLLEMAPFNNVNRTNITVSWRTSAFISKQSYLGHWRYWNQRLLPTTLGQYSRTRTPISGAQLWATPLRLNPEAKMMQPASITCHQLQHHTLDGTALSQLLLPWKLFPSCVGVGGSQPLHPRCRRDILPRWPTGDAAKWRGCREASGARYVGQTYQNSLKSSYLNTLCLRRGTFLKSSHFFNVLVHFDVCKKSVLNPPISNKLGRLHWLRMRNCIVSSS